MIRIPALLLIAPLALLAAPAHAAAPDTVAADTVTRAPRQPDASLYQSLLDEFLVVTSARGEALDTRFDYEKLYDARGRRARMVLALDALSAGRPSTMTPKQRLAWAINLYNYLVLHVATENLLVPGRKRLRYKSVDEIRLPGHTFWTAPVVTIEGQPYSLEQFERRFVFGGPRPALGAPPDPATDPRAHFALCKGAIGSPPLAPRAFKAESLDIQLDAAARNALRLPRHLRFNAALGVVEGSEVFNLNAGDFGWHDRMIEFVKQHGPPAIQSEIRKRKLTRFGGFLPFDPLLNQVERKPASASS